MLFTRRKDLSPQARMNIALSALLNQGVYGHITRLANMYSCSRLFIYQQLWILRFCLIMAFSDIETRDTNNRPCLNGQKLILLMRLEAKASVGSISTILKQLDLPASSTGYVSQFLREQARKLPDAIDRKPSISIIVDSDEIFASRKPILVTIEPHSLAIIKIELADDRKADTWRNHWDDILSRDIAIDGLVSDRATGLTKGFQNTDILFWFPDHFHEFRDLNKLVKQDLFKDACKAIEKEEETGKIQDKRRAEAKMELFDNACYLLRRIYGILPFINSDGGFRSGRFIRGEVVAALELMTELHCLLIRKQAKMLLKRSDEIFGYLRVVEQVKDKLKAMPHDAETAKALRLIWRHEKLASTYRGELQRYHREERKFWEYLVQSRLKERYSEVKEQVYRLLDSVPRSSSLIETVNSLIRPYLNACKGKITRETLNLIMFYHNYHPFAEGKRKGKAPIEILTGKPLEKSWVDILLEDIT